MPRCAPLLIALLAGLAPGCLVVPFGYPTWSRTPELKVNGQGDEVVALLVRREWTFHSTMNTPRFWGQEEPRLEEILAVDQEAALTAQNRVSKDYVIAMASFLVWLVEAQRDRYEVLLYRPGHRLIVVPEWTLSPEVKWRPVAALEDQLADLERATFDVAELELTNAKRKYVALISKEWRRLAAQIPEGHSLRERVEWKRKWWAPPTPVEGE